MAEQYTNGDSLRAYLTGASSDDTSQRDPDLSLGGYRSSMLHQNFQIERRRAIDNIRVMQASGAAGAGLGSLQLSASEKLIWTPPGGTAGAGVAILSGETKVIESNSASSWLRVYRKNASAMQGAESVLLGDVWHNALGFTETTSAEATAGGTVAGATAKNRALMLKNVSALSVTGVTAHIGTLGTQRTSAAAQLSGAGGGTIGISTGTFADWPQRGYCHIKTNVPATREIVYYSSRTSTVLTVPAAGRGLGGTAAAAGASTDTLDAVPGILIAKEAPVSSAIQTIATEITQPTGLTDNYGITAGTGLSIGTLATGELYGLWFRQFWPAGVLAEASTLFKIVLTWTYEAVSYTNTLRGRSRIINTALDRYEVYRGIGVVPDYTAAAFDTSATVPWSPATTLSANSDHWFTIRKRNKYGLIEQNRAIQVISLTSGVENARKPSAPEGATCVSTTGGKLKFTAMYNPLQDGTTYDAETWAIWVTSDGTTPNTAAAATHTQAMTTGVVTMQLLSYIPSTTYAEGVTIKWIIRTRREGSPDVDSANDTVGSFTHSATGPTRTNYSLLHGTHAGPIAIQSLTPDTQVIDGTNNIYLDYAEGTVSFYADTVLVWRCIYNSYSGRRDLYVPSEFTLSGNDAVGVGGNTDAVETISWTVGDKRLGINVAGTRHILIDITNLKINYVNRSGNDAILQVPGTEPLLQLPEAVRFLVWDPGVEDWQTYTLVDTAGQWNTSPVNLKRNLNQAQIIAL